MIWNRLASLLAKPAIANWLIRRAMKTPYLHLPTNDNPSYMARYWVFNPYDRVTNKPRWFFCPWSIRIHHIKREDFDRELHDHPWNARTIILKGWYTEKRLLDKDDPAVKVTLALMNLKGVVHEATEVKIRRPGDTAKLGFGEYHTITDVDPDGAWTLFISGPWRGVWGFLVDGVKVPWREYLGIPPKGGLGDGEPAPKWANGGYVGEIPGHLLGETPLEAGTRIHTDMEQAIRAGEVDLTVINRQMAFDPTADEMRQRSIPRDMLLSREPATGIPYCGVCKGYGQYQDGDSGSELDGYAPNIVECDCAEEERLPQYRRPKCQHCPGCKP